MVERYADPVAAGRDALERHAWNEAYDVLTAADGAGSLDGEGLTLLAAAAYWTAHPDQTVEYLERSYGAFLEQGDRASASMVAFRVAEQHGMRMALPQAQGWAARAMHLAEEEPTWPVHGWLTWMHGLLAWFAAGLRDGRLRLRHGHGVRVDVGGSGSVLDERPRQGTRTLPPRPGG